MSDALSLKERVRNSGWFGSSSDGIKSEGQDIIDQILKICFPYLCQANKWTDMQSKIKSNCQKLDIKVMPKYLPEGFSDAAKVIIGVKQGKDQPSSVLLWRSKNYVYSMYESIVSREILSSETDTIKIDIMNNSCPRIVTSSHGEAAKLRGNCLGQYYEYGQNIFEQFNTNAMHQRTMYIYRINPT